MNTTVNSSAELRDHLQQIPGDWQYHLAPASLCGALNPDRIPVNRLAYFIGGNDLEMDEIRHTLAALSATVFDRNLAWGACYSHYETELHRTIRQGLVPVSIELKPDTLTEELEKARAIVIDHHGENAGHDKATSLEQVFALLERPLPEWTRWRMLVSENDRGHIRAMRQAGATHEEIAVVRMADRRSQGLTESDDADAKHAIDRRVELPGLTIIETDLTSSSAIADLMTEELGGPGYRNLLIRLKDKVAFYGEGDAIYRLAKTHPDGWYGGDLPFHGFWGKELDDPRHFTDVRSLLEETVEATEAHALNG